MYERGEWAWKDVQDCTVIACAAPPVGGRSEITPRLSRRMNMLCLPKSDQAVLTKIFASILGGFLTAWGFSDKIKGLQDAAIASTIEVYLKIQEELRATPAKFHYSFNLRDVSKVVQGLCMTKPVSVAAPETFMRLWANECFRVFYDRLISDDDRNWFKALTLDLFMRNFKLPAEKDEIFDELKFGDLLKLDAPT